VGTLFKATAGWGGGVWVWVETRKTLLAPHINLLFESVNRLLKSFSFVYHGKKNHFLLFSV
jgi:hypothetical protein